jgi:hypothetical protein
VPPRDWLLLLPLGCASACLVPGLEVGASPDDAGGSSGSGGVVFFSEGGVTASGAGGSATSGSGGAGAGGIATSGGSGGVGGSGAGMSVGGSAGAAGNGALHCGDRPIPPKSEWKVTASSSSKGSGMEQDPLFNPPAHAIDGLLEERWASGKAQEQTEQWFHIDFGREVAVSELTLQQGVALDDFPRGYAISMSNRHTDFEAHACTEGRGSAVSESVIPLGEMAVGRYLLIQQTGTGPRWWSIAELDVACHE